MIDTIHKLYFKLKEEITNYITLFIQLKTTTTVLTRFSVCVRVCLNKNFDNQEIFFYFLTLSLLLLFTACLLTSSSSNLVNSFFYNHQVCFVESVCLYFFLLGFFLDLNFYNSQLIPSTHNHIYISQVQRYYRY